MLSYRDLLAMKVALKEGSLTESKLRESLVLSGIQNVSLPLLVQQNGLISSPKWQQYNSRARLLPEFCLHESYYEWENQLVLEKLLSSRPQGEREELMKRFHKAQKRGRGLLSGLVKENQLSPEDLKALQILREEPLACSDCDLEIEIDPYIPWRSYPCPLCSKELVPLSPETREIAKSQTTPGELKVTRTVDQDLNLKSPRRSSQPSPGKKWARYRLLDKLGEGGMGAVYKAYDPGLDRVVALKMISSPDISESQWKRFQREMRLSARLRHSNIAPIYDWGEVEGTPFFTLAYIEGQDLEDYIESRGVLSEKEALELMSKVAEAVSYAHREGVIHRDIKPANIMIDQEGKPYLMDFGLAREIRSEGANLTQTGAVVGTPQYMAPEQAFGKKDIDQRCDVYGLGGVLYFVLTGKPPIEGRDILEILNKVTSEPPLPLRKRKPTLSRHLETITHKCLEKKKTSRYPNVRTLLRDLEALQKGDPIWASPPTPLEKLGRWIKRRAVPLSLGVTLVLLVILAIFTAGLLMEEKSKESVEDMFQKGRNLYHQESYDQAQKALSQVIEISGHHRKAHFYLGQIYFLKNQTDRAKKEFYWALKMDSRNSKTYDDLMTFFEKQKNYKAALEILNYYDKKVQGKHYFNFYSLRGWIYAMLGKNKEAVEDYTQALSQRADLATYSNRGAAYYRLGKYKKARKDLTKAVGNGFPNAGAYILLGKIYRMEGDYEMAEQFFNKAIQFSPDLAVGYNERGILYYLRGRLNRALADLNKALSLKKKAKFYTNRGLVYLKKDKYSKAKMDFHRALKLRPDYVPALLSLSHIDYHQGRFEKALEQVDSIIKKRPRFGRAYLVRGEILFQQGKKENSKKIFSRALKAVKKAHDLNPNLRNLYFYWGALALVLDDFQVAKVKLNLHIKRGPVKKKAYFYRGCAHYRLKEYQETIGDMNRSLKKGYRIPDIYFYRGNSFRKLGRHKKAIPDLKRFLRQKPRHPTTPQIREYLKEQKGN